MTDDKETGWLQTVGLVLRSVVLEPFKDSVVGDRSGFFGWRAEIRFEEHADWTIRGLPLAKRLEMKEKRLERELAKLEKARLRKVPISVGWPFKAAFVFICFVTIACIAAQVVLVERWVQPNATQTSVLENLGFAWKMGFGAVVGLIGGKATK